MPNSVAGRCALECVHRFAALDRKMNHDDEEGFFSAESDVEPTFTANREGKQCSTGNSFELFLHALPDWRYQAKRVKRVGFLLYQKNNREVPMLPTLSIRELQAPILDDEAWCSDAQTSETDARAGTLGTKVEALGEDGETASLSTDCLQEDLSSSNDDDFSLASLEQMSGPQGCKGFYAHGFDSEESELEEWSF
eukprot:519190-Amphidinium_carterae.1